MKGLWPQVVAVTVSEVLYILYVHIPVYIDLFLLRVLHDKYLCQYRCTLTDINNLIAH